MARCKPYTTKNSEVHISVELDVVKKFFEHDKHDKHNHEKGTKSTQWDPNVEFDCCDEIVTKKVTPNQLGNQEIYQVITDHTSSNEIQAQQHENEEIHVLACSNESDETDDEDSTSDDEYLPINTMSSSESKQLNDDNDSDDGIEYYKIENTHSEHIQQLPIYPIDNHIVELSEDDEADGWKVEQNDVNLWPCETLSSTSFNYYRCHTSTKARNIFQCTF